MVSAVAELSYEICVKGRVGASVPASFEDMDSAFRPAETVLRGKISDQAQLHGLLERIQLLGLELVEVRQVPGDPEPRAEPR
jgi:hypothetical protein